MNVNNNHLVDAVVYNEMPAAQKAEYESLPDHLNRAAHRKLAGKKEATVAMNSGGKLSRWAKKKREARKKAAMSGKGSSI